MVGRESERLGVCIPTYNRPALLADCLASIQRSATVAGRQIPIFIADDSCCGASDEVVHQFASRYSHVHLRRNRQTLGIDANVQQVVDDCDCEYAWILGEDDRITASGMAALLRAIEDHGHPPFIFANYVYVDNEYRYVLSEPLIPLTAGPVELPASDMLERWAWAMGFIGSCVVRKATWDASDPARYAGTYYNHVGRIMEGIAGGRVVITSEVAVLNRAQNSKSFTWSDCAFDVYYGWDEMLARLKPIYGANAVERARASATRLFGHRSLKWVMSKRADGIYSLDQYRQYIAAQPDHSARFLWAARCIAVLPPQVFVPLKFLAKTLPTWIRRRPIPDAWLREASAASEA